MKVYKPGLHTSWQRWSEVHHMALAPIGQYGGKYLMIDVSASTKEEEAVAALKQHMPVIRDKLLTLFGEQKAAELKTADAKEKLRGEALACIQSVMEERYGSTGVDEVLFTRFVMQ